MTTQMNLFTKDEFERLYKRLRSEEGMMTVMSRMQKNYGINERKAYENADTVIQLVAAQHNAFNMLSDDAQEVLDQFLNESSVKMNGSERKVMLHLLYFGLKLYQDEELIEKMKEGTSEAVLFKEYYTHCSEDSSITEAALEDEIRKMMGNYRISAKSMRYIVRQMEQNQNLRATVSELGEDGMRFKSIVAMDLYLRHKDTMTMEEAVHIACTNVELQAVADGVSHGQITEDTAKKILTVISLLCLIIVIAWMTKNPEVVAKIAKALSIKKMSNHTLIMLLGLGVFRISSVIGDKIADWMGQFAAKRTFVRTAEEVNTSVAMEALCDRMEAEIEQSEAEQSVVEQVTVREVQVEMQEQPAVAYV